MKQSKQFLEVCLQLNIDPKTIPHVMDVKDALKLLKRKVKIPKFSDVEKRYRDHFLAEWSLIVITEAMNLQPDGTIWTPDYTNNEYRWEPNWFSIKADKDHPGGFGFSDSTYDYWYSITNCGSRFAFQKEDRLRFVMKQFEGLFIKKYLIKK